MKYALICVGRNCEEIRKALPFSVELKGTLRERIEKAFKYYNAVIFVGSLGILVRQIGEMMVSKFVDPAVIVVDERLRFCIPVLSAHIGGASDICLLMSKNLGCKPVFTTATDVNNVVGVDRLARRYNFAFLHRDGIKDVNQKLLLGGEITVSGTLGRMKLPPGYTYVDSRADVGVNSRGSVVTLLPRDVAMGVGFHAGVDVCDVYREYMSLLPLGLRLRVGIVATIESRWKLPLFHEFARLVGALHTRKCTLDEIRTAERQLGINVNRTVMRYMGVSAVAEPCGYIASFGGKRLLTVKGKISKFSLFQMVDFLWQEGVFNGEEVPNSIR